MNATNDVAPADLGILNPVQHSLGKVESYSPSANTRLKVVKSGLHLDRAAKSPKGYVDPIKRIRKSTLKFVAYLTENPHIFFLISRFREVLRNS
jgi:hypothetical protein